MELKREDFINLYPPANHMNKTAIQELWKKEPFHLYLHIPFCLRKCGFCYYRSVTLGKREVPGEYVEALQKEIRQYASMPEIQNRSIRSLYLGGGTPTLLSEEQMESILSLIKDSFKLAPDFEFCCEARPGSETTYSKLKLLKSFGLHRLSLGCQSLDEEVLKANGCNHGAEEFYTVFEMARSLGIRTINADLLSGLVNQSLESFMDSIERILRLRPENVSIYKMEVYLNSALFKKLREGSIELISDEAEINYIRNGYAKLLESGYTMANHFNFITAPEHDHVHRRGQWDGEELLGVGASSYSKICSFTFQNEASVENYIETLNRGELPVIRAHRVTPKERMAQRAILGLKNLNINRIKFFDDFGVDILDVFPEQFQKYENANFVKIMADRIETTFEGSLFVDDFARELFLPEHRTMMLGHAKRPEGQVASF